MVYIFTDMFSLLNTFSSPTAITIYHLSDVELKQEGHA